MSKIADPHSPVNPDEVLPGEGLLSDTEVAPGTPWEVTIGVSERGRTKSPRTEIVQAEALLEDKLTDFKPVRSKDDSIHFISAAMPRGEVPTQYIVDQNGDYVPMEGSETIPQIEPDSRIELFEPDGSPRYNEFGTPERPTFRRLQMVCGHTRVMFFDFDGPQALDEAGEPLRELNSDGGTQPLKSGIPMRWVAQKVRELRRKRIAFGLHTTSSHRALKPTEDGGTYAIPKMNCKVRFALFINDRMRGLSWREVRERHKRLALAILKEVFRVQEAGIQADPASERCTQVMYGPSYKDPSVPRFSRYNYGWALDVQALLSKAPRLSKRNKSRSRGERYGEFDGDLDQSEWLDERDPRLQLFLDDVKASFPKRFKGESGERDRFRQIIFRSHDWGIPEDQAKNVYIESALNAQNPEPITWSTLSGYWHLQGRVVTAAEEPFGWKWAQWLERRERVAAHSGSGDRASGGETGTISRVGEVGVCTSPNGEGHAVYSVSCSEGHQTRTDRHNYIINILTDLSFTTECDFEVTKLWTPPYAHGTPPTERASRVWDLMGRRLRSGVVNKPVGAGKGLLRTYLAAKCADEGLPLTVISPAVTLTWSISRSDDVPHYSDNVTVPGATSPFSLLHIVRAQGLDGVGYAVLDEAEKSFRLLFSAIGFQHDSRRVLKVLAHLWCQDRLLLTCADYTQEDLQRFLAFARDYANRNKLDCPGGFFFRDTYPALVKTVTRTTAPRLVSQIERSPEGTKIFVACTRKSTANNLKNMLGERSAVIDAETNVDTAPDALYAEHDVLCVSPAAATGLNIRTDVDRSYMLHEHRNVSPFAVAQQIARIRHDGEVTIAMPNFSPSEELIEDEDELQERLSERAEKIETLSSMRNIANGAFEDPAFLDLWCYYESKRNFEFNNHMEVLGSVLERYGWDVDLEEPEAVAQARLADQEAKERLEAAKNLFDRCVERGSSVWTKDGRITEEEARARREEAKRERSAARQELQQAVGTYPESYNTAKEQTKWQKVERIVNANLDLIKDERKRVGLPQADRKAAQRRAEIEKVFGIDASDPQHREIVEQDVDGKLTARVEMAALCRLVARGVPDLHYHDAKVWRSFKRRDDGNLRQLLVYEVSEKQTSYKVFKAEFLVLLHEAVTGIKPGEVCTPEGYYPPIEYLPDYIERCRPVFLSDAYAIAYPKKNPPLSANAIKKSVASLMRSIGTVASERVERNTRRIHRFELEMGAPGLNEETIIADVARKRAEKDKDSIEISTKLSSKQTV